MKISTCFITTLITIFSTNAASTDLRIQDVVKQGREGYFNCSFQGKKARKKCYVKNSIESVTNKDLVNFYGVPEKSNYVGMKVLNILWPDRTRSRFAWGDSMEITNLQIKNGSGFGVKFAEWPNIDYSTGLIILDENSNEYIRLW